MFDWTNLDRWPEYHEALSLRWRRPDLPGHAGWCILDDPDTTDPHQAMQCTRHAQVLESLFSIQLRAKIERLLEDNEGTGPDRRTLVVEGPSGAGKTTTGMYEVLDMWHMALAGPRPKGVDAKFHPFGYVALGRLWKEPAIVRAMADFLKVTYAASDNTQTIIGYLNCWAPHIGLRAFIIDDANFLKPDDSGRTADGLKNLLTSLNFTLIWLGKAPMSESALFKVKESASALAISAVEQIELRARRFSTEEVFVDTTQRRAEWGKAMFTMSSQLHLLRGDPTVWLRDENLSDKMYARADGRLGSAYEALREAALDAVEDPSVRFAAALGDAINRLPVIRKPKTGSRPWRSQ
ncbi:hypothetical protein [Cellulomonas endometrii]|uniref:hypothetical protein n=1 Tax=Cellulomonas endometrii TaxID=3036301 RepID=UPI0024ACCEA9|nr:hypothetical protein [Cellulomonas endometrii]